MYNFVSGRVETGERSNANNLFVTGGYLCEKMTYTGGEPILTQSFTHMKHILNLMSANLLTVPGTDVYARKDKTDNVDNKLIIKY